MPERPFGETTARQTTIKDVAREANVSIATVSRVLNGSAAVAPELAGRVRDVATALRYQPNRLAKGLAGGRSAIIGLIIPDMRNPFFLEIARGVEEAANASGYLVVLCNSDEDPRKERRYLDTLLAERIAGLIIASTLERQRALSAFEASGIPVVAVDRQMVEPVTDVVLIDNSRAVYDAVVHLIANNYRRIGMITGPLTVATGHDRLIGYRRALHDAGLPHDPTLERSGPFTAAAGTQMTEELLDLVPPVDALVLGNNRLTLAALEVAAQRSLRVPTDLGIVGFDELPGLPPALLSLTIVEQPAYEIGLTAGRRVLDRLRQPTTGLPTQRIILAHNLAIGESSRAQPAPEARVRAGVDMG